MNEVIEWLESEDGEAWSRLAHESFLHYSVSAAPMFSIKKDHGEWCMCNVSEGRYWTGDSDSYVYQSSWIGIQKFQDSESGTIPVRYFGNGLRYRDCELDFEVSSL